MSSKTTTEGFTAEERAAIKERAKETRRGTRAKVDTDLARSQRK